MPIHTSAWCLETLAPLDRPGLAGVVFAEVGVGGTFVVITMVGFQEARGDVAAHAGGNARRLMAAMTAAFAAGQIVGPLFVSLVVGTGGGFTAALLSASALLHRNLVQAAGVANISRRS